MWCLAFAKAAKCSARSGTERCQPAVGRFVLAKEPKCSVRTGTERLGQGQQQAAGEGGRQPWRIDDLTPFKGGLSPLALLANPEGVLPGRPWRGIQRVVKGDACIGGTLGVRQGHQVYPANEQGKIPRVGSAAMMLCALPWEASWPEPK